MEKRHIPAINILKICNPASGKECIDVQVNIGQVEHGFEADDYITFIDFYHNDIPVYKNCSAYRKCFARASLLWCKRIHPKFIVRLDNIASGTLTVIANCITHGSWIAETNLKSSAYSRV